MLVYAFLRASFASGGVASFAGGRSAQRLRPQRLQLLSLGCRQMRRCRVCRVCRVIRLVFVHFNISSAQVWRSGFLWNEKWHKSSAILIGSVVLGHLDSFSKIVSASDAGFAVVSFAAEATVIWQRASSSCSWIQG